MDGSGQGRTRVDFSRIKRGTLDTTVRPVHSCFAMSHFQVGAHDDLRLVRPIRVPSEVIARDFPWVRGICALDVDGQAARQGGGGAAGQDPSLTY